MFEDNTEVYWMIYTVMQTVSKNC